MTCIVLYFYLYTYMYGFIYYISGSSVSLQFFTLSQNVFVSSPVKTMFNAYRILIWWLISFTILKVFYYFQICFCFFGGDLCIFLFLQLVLRFFFLFWVSINDVIKRACKMLRECAHLGECVCV